MKPILAPTDFSDVASNAVRYAAALAQQFNTSLTVMHSIAIPVLNSDAAVVLPFDELEKDSQAQLKKDKINMANEFKGLQVDLLTQIGFAGDVISDLAATNNYSLIVVGISGEGKLDALIGSVATKVAKDAALPVLIVPRANVFKIPRSIVAAFDLKVAKKGPDVEYLIHFAQHFSAKITALTIADSEAILKEQEQKSKHLTNQLLHGTDHEIAVVKATDTIDGIKAFTQDHQTDLLVMLKRKHGFIDLLLHGSQTHAMAFETAVPLLIVHA